MLEAGRDRLLDAGFAGNVDCLVADAERLPFADNSFDCVTIGFGLRNVTDKAAALRLHVPRAEARRPAAGAGVLDAGGAGTASRCTTPIRSSSCRGWAALVAQDAASYRYLAESIRMHPDQETLLEMLRDAGFALDAVPQSDRRNRRPAPRIQNLTCPRLPHGSRPSKPLLNRSIGQSMQARRAARRLNGTSLQVHVEGLAAHSRRGVRRRLGSWRAAGAARRGRADRGLAGRRCLQLLIGGTRSAARRRRGPPGPRAHPRRRGIAAATASCSRLARPDFEEELSRLVGDLPARALSRFGAKRAFSLVRDGRAHGRRELRRISAGREPRSGQEAGTRGISAAASIESRETARPRRGAARAPRTAHEGHGADAAARRRAGCSRSSARWSATGWTISCAPRICTGRSGSCSICRRGPGFSAAPARPAASGCGSRSRSSDRSSSSSARRFRPAAI